MTLEEQAARRVELARQIGIEPVRWVATPAVIAELSDDSGRLHGLPVEQGAPRSDWGLDLVLAPRCA